MAWELSTLPVCEKPTESESHHHPAKQTRHIACKLYAKRSSSSGAIIPVTLSPSRSPVCARTRRRVAGGGRRVARRRKGATGRKGEVSALKKLRFLILHNKGVVGWLEGLEGLPPRLGLRRVAALNDHLRAPPEVTLFWWCGDTCTHDYLNFQQRSSIPVTSFLPSFLGL